MNPASLRWKIAALVTTACVVVAAVVGLLVHRATWQRTLDGAESQALEALEQSLARAGLPEDVVTVQELPVALAARLRPGRPATWYGLDHRDEPWMWAAQPYGGDGGRAVSVQISVGSELRSLYALDRDMVKAALLALAGVVPLSVLAAELPNRRLRRVARTARQIADGNLDARTDASGRDEIADIGAGLNSMAASLQRRLLAEQRFTADVAHDLRTPLMGLLTAGQLLPDGQATDLVRDRIGVLRGLVDDLLEISRLDAGGEQPDQQPVPLADLVRESLHRLGVPADLHAVGEQGHATAVTDPRRLERIVANLVLNAHAHGAAPVQITVRPHQIVIRDHGPGFPPDLLADLGNGQAQRFRTGRTERGRGHGLGLTIVSGHARVIRAALQFANLPGGGASVTVTLPGTPPAPDR
ncbi:MULTISPECIES: sensor histidine kinase [Streptosporangium]|uniref:histidine kinase n=1 Tax=Streptosporangium brasiliense TaxID=47480 RepID=A0ABT9RL53_9ACTN|nr:HAMP domain-containing sensor histidine kinase [Streptosporangium brasiliense]MDP9869541.1 signal transduction histidine kinase [Streptosporangium brasiliense]